MKKTIFSLLLTGLTLAVGAQNAPDQNNGAPPPAGDQMGGPPADANAPNAADAAEPPASPDATAAVNSTAPAPTQPQTPMVITPSQSKPAVQEDVESAFAPPAQAGTNINDLNLNFNRAPLDMVLNYLSDAAGFIIVQDTRVNGTVTVSGKHLTRDEAVNMLNAVLNKNGYAAIRDGRTLTIVDKNDAKTRDIPVNTGNNPDQIPKNAEIVTQIIPIRFVEARQLVSDLSSFVSPQATVVAIEAGNSIVITDTQANIHHLMQIIRAIDNSAEAETEIQVFPLKYASPTDVATELGNVFTSGNSTSGAQSPIRFGGGLPGGLPGGFPGGPGGFFGRMGGAAAASSSSSENDRIKKATAVSAVADSRIQAVIVTAPKDLMQEISSVIKSLDVPSERDQDVYVFKMNNGDSQQAAQVLQNMFQTSSSRTTSGSSQNSALQQRIQNNATTTSQSSSSSSGFGSSSGMGTGTGR